MQTLSRHLTILKISIEQMPLPLAIADRRARRHRNPSSNTKPISKSRNERIRYPQATTSKSCLSAQREHLGRGVLRPRVRYTRLHGRRKRAAEAIDHEKSTGHHPAPKNYHLHRNRTPRYLLLRLAVDWPLVTPWDLVSSLCLASLFVRRGNRVA